MPSDTTETEVEHLRRLLATAREDARNEARAEIRTALLEQRATILDAARKDEADGWFETADRRKSEAAFIDWFVHYKIDGKTDEDERDLDA